MTKANTPAEAAVAGAPVSQPVQDKTQRAAGGATTSQPSEPAGSPAEPAAKSTASRPRAPKPKPSLQPGMGAIPFDGGTAFRVWAPYASKVFVSGTFNKWAKSTQSLAKEDGGCWSVDVATAKPGDQYKFRIMNGRRELWRIDPYAREVTNSIGESVIHDPAFDWGDDDFRTPPWNEMVIYEMHIGTFYQPAPDARATFDSAIEKLDYLRELGINVVLVMPPAEFPGDISWGYNPSYIFAVESNYGGPQALKRFVKTAHQHGIAVLLDVVYNHFGPSDLDLWQFDGWSENGKGGIYFYNDWRSNTPWGDTRPDYGRAEVRQYIRDNALMWLDDYHLDGLRFDATAYIRNVKGNDNPGDDLAEGWGLLRWLNDEINARSPWKITIAEDLRNNQAITAATSEGGAGFDAQWDAGFVHPVRAAIIDLEDAHRNMGAVAGALENRYNNGAFKRVIYTESHDEVANGKARVPQEISPEDAASWFAKKRSTLGAGLVFTAPGIPMIFQGQEFLMNGWFDDNAPLDWGRLEAHSGIFALYGSLFRLRRNWENHTKGLSGEFVHVYHTDLGGKVIAYHRWFDGGPGDSCIVVANFTANPIENYNIGLPAPGVWHVRFNSDWNGFDPEFHNYPTVDVTAVAQSLDGLPCQGTLGVGPYSFVILSQDPPAPQA